MPDELYELEEDVRKLREEEKKEIKKQKRKQDKKKQENQGRNKAGANNALAFCITLSKNGY